MDERLLQNKIKRKYQQKFFLEYQEHYYSQNGEAGILNELLKRLGIKKGWLVEVGASDGKTLCNTFHLIKSKQFNGIYIDSGRFCFRRLKLLAEEYPNLLVFLATINPTSFNQLLGKTAIPNDFDILSLDIDSFDYQVWEALEYKPKIVIIEANPRIPGEYIFNPDSFWKDQTRAVDIKKDKLIDYAGSSFTSMWKLGIKKGYTYIGPCTTNGIICQQTGNMFFIRNDLVQKLKLNEIPEIND